VLQHPGGRGSGDGACGRAREGIARAGAAHYGEHMNDDRDTGTAGMRAMFWTWMGIIVVGLTVMIVIPLTGR
jgi:hypothetical protein